MRFDVIVVPRGAEARAVEQGWPSGRPLVITVPAGAAAGSRLTGADAAPAKTALVLGVCGALDPALAVGDTVVYSRIAEGADVIELDRELAESCAKLFGRAPVESAAVERVVGSVADKSALREASGAAVIDMEAAAIARAFHLRGIRVAMVRVVSDDAASELPNLSDIYDANGGLRPIALTRALLRTPRRSLSFVVRVFRALRALQLTAARLSRS